MRHTTQRISKSIPNFKFTEELFTSMAQILVLVFWSKRSANMVKEQKFRRHRVCPEPIRQMMYLFDKSQTEVCHRVQARQARSSPLRSRIETERTDCISFDLEAQGDHNGAFLPLFIYSFERYWRKTLMSEIKPHDVICDVIQSRKCKNKAWNHAR